MCLGERKSALEVCQSRGPEVREPREAARGLLYQRRFRNVQDIDPASAPTVSAGPLTRSAFLIGSAALLIAMATDSVAVLGRHVGWPLLGAIEVVQGSVVLVAAAAMVIATLHQTHARVHILTERLPNRWQVRLDRIANACAALTFVVIACGSAWLLAELWLGHEETELLRIPVRWLRAFWVCAAVLIAGLFAVRAYRANPA